MSELLKRTNKRDQKRKHGLGMSTLRGPELTRRNFKRRLGSTNSRFWFGSVLVVTTIVWNGAIGRDHVMMSLMLETNETFSGAPLAPVEQHNLDHMYTAQSTTHSLKKERRSKIHFCHDSSTKYGREILESQEFGFQEINATRTSDWDVIFGGYQNCGSVSGESDWNMEKGLNRIMKDRGDWKVLKPHQVFHPCMGCQQSYCNKRELCGILRSIDPRLCYRLPEDLNRLKQHMTDMSSTGSKTTAEAKKKDMAPFVLKSIKKHGGKGVQFIWHPSQLPKANDMSDYIVQKWMDPHLYSGMFHRKTELRIHVAVTSVSRLRAYYHIDHVITLAARKYGNAMVAMMDKCMVDTSSRRGCDTNMEQEFQRFLSSVPNLGRQVLLDDYTKAVGMSQEDKDLLLDRAHHLTSQVIRAGHAKFEAHPVNQDIYASDAMCFSHMRIDLGIGEDLMPFVYEVTEIPSKNGPGNVTRTVARDLFTMIGLNALPMPSKERAAFEQNHRGGWRPLPGLM